MKHGIRKIVGAVLVLAGMAALATGWLYRPLGRWGNGAGPEARREQLQRREDMERFVLARSPRVRR